MRSFDLLVKLLVLVTLILNGTAVHGVQLFADRYSDSSDGNSGMPHCHSAADRLGSSHDAQQDPGKNAAGQDAPGHDRGGAGCTCACAHHSPPLALVGTALGLLSGAASVLTTPRVGFHSLTPLPLLRPPIG